MPISISDGRIPQWGRHWRPEGLTPLWCPCSIEHWLTGKNLVIIQGWPCPFSEGFEILKHHPVRALKRWLSTKFSVMFKRGTWDMFIANLQHHVDVFLFPNFSQLSFFLACPNISFYNVGPTAAIRVCLQVREVMEAAKSTKKHEQRSRPYWFYDFPENEGLGPRWFTWIFRFTGDFPKEHAITFWQIHLLWLWGRMFFCVFLFFFFSGV